uniref:C-type lectin domain-containing protein n=1 Tax=Hucho hucho TaxID=62062 RepID=A0A4W5PT80_9TELE
CTEPLLYCLSLNPHIHFQKYHYVSEEKSWSEAQQYCRQHYTDLAFISNQEEVNQLLPISGGDWTWIGLHRDANDPTGWTWSGGENSAFKFWMSREPNNAVRHLTLICSRGSVLLWLTLENNTFHCTYLMYVTIRHIFFCVCFLQ